MATDDISKTLKSLDKTISKIEKSESMVEDHLSDQLKLDKKLNKIIDDQLDINKSILKQLKDLNDQLDEMQRASRAEGIQQHRRFIAEIVIAVATLAASLVAAFAALYPIYH